MFCTISGTEGGVVHVGLVKAPPVVRCWPFRGGCFVVVLCCLFLDVGVSVAFRFAFVHFVLVRFVLPGGRLLGCSLCVLTVFNFSCIPFLVLWAGFGFWLLLFLLFSYLLLVCGKM